MEGDGEHCEQDALRFVASRNVWASARPAFRCSTTLSGFSKYTSSGEPRQTKSQGRFASECHGSLCSVDAPHDATGSPWGAVGAEGRRGVAAIVGFSAALTMSVHSSMIPGFCACHGPLHQTCPLPSRTAYCLWFRLLLVTFCNMGPSQPRFQHSDGRPTTGAYSPL